MADILDFGGTRPMDAADGAPLEASDKPAMFPDDPDQFMGLDPEALFRKLKGWFDDDLSHWKGWRTAAEEDFDYAALEQWADEDKEKLEKMTRVPIVFDRIGPVLRSVSGQQISNRQEVRYSPREAGDVKVNEILTGAAEWFRDQADADSEESEAFYDTLVCGIGCAETGLDFDENPDGDPFISRIDPLEMLFDHASRKANFRDARRVWRVKEVSLAEAEVLFPEVEPADLDAAWATFKTEDTSPNDASRPAYEGRELDEREVAGKDKMVTLVECQWFEKECFYRVLDPMTGTEATFSEDEYKVLVERMRALGAVVKGVKQHRKVFRKAFIGAKVLEVTPTLDPKRFSYHFITGFRDRNRGHWFGLVKPMKDPQRWANKWLQQILHILNSQAGAGLMQEGEQRENPREFEAEWAKPNSIVTFKNGALSTGKVQPKPQAQLPVGYFQLLEFAQGAAREASGVNLEQLGMREAVQPGVLEYQRRQSGVQVLAGIFDSLRRYRFEQGRMQLTIIQNHLSDGRLIRISGDESEALIPLVRDMTIGEYDVIVDDAPTAPNQKEASWQIIQSLFPMFGQAMMENPAILLAVLRQSPLPSSFVDDLEEAMAGEEPTPEEQEQQDLELENARQMVRAVGAEASKDEAQAANLQAQAALNQAKAQAQQGQGGAEASQAFLNHAKARAEQARAFSEQSQAALNQAKARAEQARGMSEHAQAMNYRAQAHLHVAQARKTMMPDVKVQIAAMPRPQARGKPSLYNRLMQNQRPRSGPFS